MKCVGSFILSLYFHTLIDKNLEYNDVKKKYKIYSTKQWYLLLISEVLTKTNNIDKLNQHNTKYYNNTWNNYHKCSISFNNFNIISKYNHYYLNYNKNC